jgi:hypothetical protein
MQLTAIILGSMLVYVMFGSVVYGIFHAHMESGTLDVDPSNREFTAAMALFVWPFSLIWLWLLRPLCKLGRRIGKAPEDKQENKEPDDDYCDTKRKLLESFRNAQMNDCLFTDPHTSSPIIYGDGDGSDDAKKMKKDVKSEMSMWGKDERR